MVSKLLSVGYTIPAALTNSPTEVIFNADNTALILSAVIVSAPLIVEGNVLQFFAS
jgi:hypothetical protein